MRKKLYIAYGSNLNRKQMEYRCPDAKLAGVGKLPNYRLEFRRVLTVVPSPGSSVPIAVWKISASDEANLDVYEGYPKCYRKENLHVVFLDGTDCSAMVYVMTGGYLAPPSAFYYKIVADGFRDCGLDEATLKQALKESCGKTANPVRMGG